MKILTSIIGLAIFLAPVAAYGQDAGAGVIVKGSVGNAAVCTVVNVTDLCFYTFTTAVHTALFTVQGSADVCLNTDTTATAAGDARIVIRKMENADVALAATEENSKELPNSTLSDSNCYAIPRGAYYVVVTVARSGSEEPLVTLTGRSP